MKLNCKNCETLFEGNFCPNCSQKVITERFTVRDSLIWLFASIFNLERGFIYTAKEVILHPGKVVSEYTNGITVRYVHPFRFLFVLATISTIVGVYTHAYEEMGQMGAQLNQDQSAAQLEFGKNMTKVMGQYMSFIIMGMIPFYAICTKLFYRKRKKNYAEHLILNSFANSASIVIGFPVILLYPFVDSSSVQWLGVISLLISAVVMSRAYSQYFKENIVLSALKFFLSFFLVMLMVMLLTAFVVIIHILLIKFAGFENIYKATTAATEVSYAY